MNESMKLQLSQKQTIVTAAMMTSLHILQMNNLQLFQYVQELVNSNVAIDISSLSEHTDDEPIPVQFDYSNPYSQWQEYSHNHSGQMQRESNADKEQMICGKAESNSINLYFHTQVNAMNLPKEDRLIVCTLISLLDRNGRLEESDEELAELLGQSVETIRRCVSILQSLEPAGSGARTLSECILLQLRRLPEDTTVAERLVQEYLPELSKKKLRAAARGLGVSLREAEMAYTQILATNPKPLNGFSDDTAVNYIIPDIHVIQEGSNFRCVLNDRFVPKIRIDRQYLEMLQSENLDTSARDYLQKCCTEAGAVTRYISYRESTLQRVMEYIIQAQRQFFLYGPGYRVAMSNREIAEALDLHDSTISRAINGKFFDCNWGVFSLKSLFSRGLMTTDRMNCVDYDRVVAAMKKMIETEPKDKPLSDQMISDALNGLSVSISRRTVSKYRQSLHIPNAAARSAAR